MSENFPGLDRMQLSTIFVKLLLLWRIRQAHNQLPPLNVAHKLQRAAQVRAHHTIHHWIGEWGCTNDFWQRL